VDQKDQLTILKAVHYALKKNKKVQLLIIGKGEKKRELEEYIKKTEKLLLVYEFSNPKLQLSRTWVSKCSQKICKKSQYLTQKTQQLKRSS
jgi:glycosyltransferase involved in cell wall biosynthesis